VSDAAPISPRGIPPIRTDWIADVAWRTAAIGPAALSMLGDDDAITLVDHVDGHPWRIEAFRVSDAHASWVELDGDLFLPTDQGAATMRVAIALVPSWDAQAGVRITEARVEVGPRGAVTFDPENWMLRIPDPITSRPALEGVSAGTWHGVPDAPRSPMSLDGLADRRVGFGELVEIAEGGATWIASLPVYEPTPTRGWFARLRGSQPLGTPVGSIVIQADGPLSVEPTALLAGEDFPEVGVIDGVEASAGEVRIVGAQLSAAGGWIGVHGNGLRICAVAH
jgi:hypothetical protein